MDNSEILDLENKLLYPTAAEPMSVPLYFLRLITDDFSNKQELGRGGYGVVYKGLLRRGDAFIAVKKFHNYHVVQGDEQFQKVATSFVGIQHPNVIRLLGYCSESKGEMARLSNGKTIIADKQTRILCFEYMCNESLDKYLSDESSGLEWNMRYKIIKGICHGLNFLHERNIIHLDLKPQNILMDATMMPKIADFDLSRLLGEQKSHTVTKNPNPPGTRGYMAPEYIDKGVISKEADIFSLGVIIIEILQGCKDYPNYGPSIEVFQHFTEKVLTNWRNRFERSSNYTTPELHTQLVKQCIKIGLKCVHPDKEKRPNVSNIIEILNAAEQSCYDHNGEDLPVDHQMGSQEGLEPSAVLREDDGLVTLNKIELKGHKQAWITKSMMKSAVAPLQPQHSLAALPYQGARNASFLVVHKALASLEDNKLKDWATTINLRPSMEVLEQELKSVKVILESTLGKVIHILALEEILMVLRQLVYDAEDLLDEMEYFRIQDMLDAGQHDEGCTHNLDLNVPFCPPQSSFHDDDNYNCDDDDNDDDDDDSPELPSIHDEPPKLIFDRDNASRRIEYIVKEMKIMQEKVSSAIELLGSDWSTAPNITQNRATISESIEPKLYGRESMLKRIIDDITKGRHSSKFLTVIPIVGPGGIGKTTLAQHIYHSGEVLEHFDVSVWTCVSLKFNVNKIIEKIQSNIPKVDQETSNGTASDLIGQRLKNKRLLLVLDDIWDCSDEDEWKQLLVPFQKSQVQGNIIIVTTRFPVQAHKMVQKHDHSIYLQGLDSKPFEELFLEIIFGDDDKSRNDHKYLFETGIMIARRLKGSPLAAKTVGKLLKGKLDLDHWKRVLESKEWEHSDGKNDIMPALKLSFDHLPPQLQLCFSYCSLFPQDYKFEREELINFWIGLEVLHPTRGENKRVEDIGLSHLTELVSYGFLENKGGNDGRTCYIIHDLLHELARKVSSLECLSIYSSSQVSLNVLPSIRHLSINIDDTSVKDRLTLKYCVEDFYTLDTRLKVQNLWTLMIFGKHHGCFVKAFGHLFREAKALRLVFLSGASYDVKDLLHNFYCLIHLRYLRIKSSPLDEAKFPNKISRFYHMKVLDAKHCDIIDYRLPRDISNLVNLRHLLVQNDTKHSRIIEVGKLRSLQELRRFVVKQGGKGFELRQIGHLEELSGSLRIDGLQKVLVPKEADEAKLMLKRHLHELILCWNFNHRSTNDSTLEEHVLERLKPSHNLQNLSIIGHRGGTCPSWLGMNLSLSGLKSLCLDDVSWKTFPPIGDLWLVNVPHEEISINIPEKRFGNLRMLELVKLSGLKTWVVHAPCQLLPYLEVLIIRDCSQLMGLSFPHSASCCQQGKDANDNIFSRLRNLEIKNCPQLSLFPPFPWTEALCSITIKGISSINYLDCGKENEYSLTIEGKKDTNDDSMFWNVLALHKLTGLRKLTTCQCGSLALHSLPMLSSLRTLEMFCSSDVFPFVEADSHVKNQFPVESLTIREWSGSGKELTQLLCYFPKLSHLSLTSLEKVTGLGVNMNGQRATGSSSSANITKVEQQQGARAEDDVIVVSKEAERGLLLLPPQLQELEMYNCNKLSLLRSNPHDDSNEEDGRSGGGGELQGTSIRKLYFLMCPKLLSSYSSSSFSSSFPFPNSLEHLTICEAGVGTEAAQLPLSNLTSLSSLSILNCQFLRGEGLLSLLAHGHLTKLWIRGTPNFFVDSEPPWVHEQELPSSSSKLQELIIDDVVGFTTAPLRHSLHFSSLTSLIICDDNKVERFTEEQEALLFVNSLEEIAINDCRNLQTLPKRLHGLPNLKRLCIWSCRAIQMLPKNYLPHSLQKLVIQNCPAIRSLPEVDDLPSSLRKLDVSDIGTYGNSKELRSQCRRFINIIPIVKA